MQNILITQCPIYRYVSFHLNCKLNIDVDNNLDEN